MTTGKATRAVLKGASTLFNFLNLFNVFRRDAVKSGMYQRIAMLRPTRTMMTGRATHNNLENETNEEEKTDSFYQ
jgi:hypothetical protein